MKLCMVQRHRLVIWFGHQYVNNMYRTEALTRGAYRFKNLFRLNRSINRFARTQTYIAIAASLGVLTKISKK